MPTTIVQRDQAESSLRHQLSQAVRTALGELVPQTRAMPVEVGQAPILDPSVVGWAEHAERIAGTVERIYRARLASTLRQHGTTTGPLAAELDQLAAQYRSGVEQRATAWWPAVLAALIAAQQAHAAQHTETPGQLATRIVRALQWLAPAALILAILAARQRLLDATLDPGRRREILADMRQRWATQADDRGWPSRVDEFATTEATSAVNAATAAAGELIARVDRGVRVEQVWRSMRDRRVRGSHRVADGQTRRLGEPFRVGYALLRYPGDPAAGQPSETINCRCVLLLRITRPTGQELPMTQLTAAHESGSMVALLPADPDALAVDDGIPAGELHTTLYYLGDGADWDEAERAALIEAVRSAAAGMEPVEGDAFSVSAFNPDSTEQDTALVLGVSGPALSTAREAITVALAPWRPQIPEQHDPWIPHISLKYDDDVALLRDYAGSTGPVTYDRVRVAFAGEHTDIPLGGSMPDELAVVPNPDFFDDSAQGEQIRIEVEPGQISGVEGVRSATLTMVTEPGTDWSALGAPRVSVTFADEDEPVDMDLPDDAMVAAVVGDTDLPILDDPDRSWDGPAAQSRMLDWATDDDGDVDAARLARGHLYRDPDANPATIGAYKLPFADVIDDRLVIVPAGVRAAWGGRGVDAADISEEDKTGVRARLRTLGRRLADEFGDDGWRAPWDREDSMDASSGWMPGQLTAAYPIRPPDAPPSDWFTNPGLTKPTPLRITNSGRVYGHLGPGAPLAGDSGTVDPNANYCHLGFSGSCVTMPRSANGYRQFADRLIPTADGGRVAAGPITMGGPHAFPTYLTAEQTRSWHDKASITVADVAIGEDEHGIWLAGAARPDLTPEQLRAFAGSRISGTWHWFRDPEGNRTSRELTLVHAIDSGSNQPGFPVPPSDEPIAAAADQGDEPLVIVASRVTAEDECAPCQVTELARAVVDELEDRQRVELVAAAARVQARRQVDQYRQNVAGRRVAGYTSRQGA